MTEETNVGNGKEKATTMLEKIFNSWVKVSYDEETDTQYRKPLTKEQMDNSQLLLNEVKKVKCDDEWVKSRTEELQSVVNFQNKREYTGLKIIPIILIIYSLSYLLPSLSLLNPEIALGKGQAEIEKRVRFLNVFTRSQENKIANINNNYGKSANLSEKEKTEAIAKHQKYIDGYKKKIDKYQSISDKSLIAKKFIEGIGLLITGFVFFVTGLLYKKAFSPPQFLRDLRERKKDQKSLPKFITALGAIGAFLAGVYFKFTSLLMKQEGSFTVKKTFSSGRTTEETMINPLPIIGAAMAVGAGITAIAYMAILSPFIVGYNYLKNYVWYK